MINHILYLPEWRYPPASGDASWSEACKGEYFGPFPNGYAVRETLALCKRFSPFASAKTVFIAIARAVSAISDRALSGAVR